MRRRRRPAAQRRSRAAGRGRRRSSAPVLPRRSARARAAASPRPGEATGSGDAVQSRGLDSPGRAVESLSESNEESTACAEASDRCCGVGSWLFPPGGRRVSSTGTQAWPLGRVREQSRTETAAPGEAISFPELVWAHYLNQRELKEKKDLHGPSEAEYRRRLDAFVRENGQLLNAYWCTTEASAVALTEKPRPRVLGFLWRRLPKIRFHAATDWITKDAADAAHTLHTCETLAIRVGEVLVGTSERIAMQWILSVAGYVLGIVDQSAGKPSRQELATTCRRARL